MKKTYDLKKATERCGYKRTNTMREKYLASEEERNDLGHRIIDGRVHLDAHAVDELAGRLIAERAARGNWRVRNLGRWAESRTKRPTGRKGHETDE